MRIQNDSDEGAASLLYSKSHFFRFSFFQRSPIVYGNLLPKQEYLSLDDVLTYEMKLLARILLSLNLFIVCFVIASFKGFIAEEILFVHIEIIVFCGYGAYLAALIVFLFLSSMQKKGVFSDYIGMLAINVFVAFAHYMFYHAPVMRTS
ncbi:MAG: hypothetical protein ACFHU9_15175 [Fluviicola sp.]